MAVPYLNVAGHNGCVDDDNSDGGGVFFQLCLGFLGFFVSITTII